MYETLLFIHSSWAFLALLILIVASLNAIVGYFGKKEYGATNFRIALFTLIVSHIQVLLGIVLLITAFAVNRFGDVGMKEVMGNPTLRLYIIEHPITMILAVALITIGYSKHKKKLTSTPKFKFLAVFYTIALILVLARIPWVSWI